MPSKRRPVRKKSLEAHERACRFIPGGVNSPARAFGAVGGTPITIARGEGPYLIDVDGNRYLDYIGSWGPLILGHCHPRVVAAVEEALHEGSSFGAPTRRETLLAELVIKAVPSIKMVRFTSSGTEAAMSAVRVARGYTGRDKIIKFAGCYHGHVDALLVQAGSSATTLGVPNSPGVPAGATRDTIILEFNDVEGLKEAFDEHRDQIAAILLEPVAGNMGLVSPSEAFLKAVRRLTQSNGVVLIFDEVMTGFRVAYGGAQEVLGVTPDMTILGKIIGGGLPVAAYGGRKEILQKVSPSGPIFQAGTLSGNPLAMAAGIAMLQELKENPPYRTLESRATKLCTGMFEAANRLRLPFRLCQMGSMFTLFFTDRDVTNYTTAKTCDTKRFARFFWELMDRGVYWPCSQFEAAFLSAAHTDQDIETTITAAEEALAAVAEE